MSQILNGLTKQQKEAATYKKGPLLIIAGAGTGKTMVITKKIAWLIEQKLAKPEEILALTFTDKAAGEMEERVDILVPYGYVNTWISTFHAFCDRILRDHALEMGLPLDFKVLTTPEQIIFFQDHLFVFNLSKLRPLSDPTKYIDKLISYFSRLKDEYILPEEYVAYAQSAQNVETTKEKEKDNKKELEIANAYKTYQELMLGKGNLDFGDQIIYTIKLFTENPKILEKYINQFKYILVDEFQDTNYAQHLLLKLLAGQNQNITVVADDDQSIYRFRGAAFSNVMDFTKAYPSAKIISITENFRSTQQILDLSYRLITHNNPNRLE